MKFAVLGFGLLIAAFISGCGGGSQSPVAPVGLSVTPTVVTVMYHGTQAFSAVDNGIITKDVTWSVEDSNGNIDSVNPSFNIWGKVTPDGLYSTPGKPGVYRVVATGKTDPTKSAYSTVTVTNPLTTLAEGSGAVYSPMTKRIYAIVPGQQGIDSLAIINPLNASIEEYANLGGKPLLKRMSDDGSSIYLLFSDSLARFDTVSKKVVSRFSVGMDATNQPYKVVQISISPTNPSYIAVMRKTSSSDYSIVGYVDGVQIQGAYNLSSNSTVTIAYGANTSRIYVGAFTGTQYQITALSVDGSAVKKASSYMIPSNLNFDARTESMVYFKSKIFTTYGDVVDAETGMALGTLELPTGSVQDNISITPVTSIDKIIIEERGSVSINSPVTYKCLGNISPNIFFADDLYMFFSHNVIFAGEKSIALEYGNHIYLFNPAPGL